MGNDLHIGGPLARLGLGIAVAVVILDQASKYWLVHLSGLGEAGGRLVLGGAIGNAIDRPLMGGVVDFVSLHAGGFNWYVFNIADVGVVVGAALLLYESILGSRKTATDGA
jgi:signal peptidase II